MARLKRIGGVVSLLLLAASPLYGNDTASVNSSGLVGEMGNLFASPPASCTAVPSGALGDCSLRGAAIVAASAANTYFDDTSFSDVENGDIDGDGIENGVDNCALVANPAQTDSDFDTIGDACDTNSASDIGALSTPTDIGQSFVINFCDSPSCGHLLRGDVLRLDENGDGKLDDTWIDSNFNGVIDNGEIDRLRGEQFAWGAASVVESLGTLGPEMAAGNLFPAGVVRMEVRLALANGSSAGSCDARVDNAACLDGDPYTPNPGGIDPDFWGLCDPDKFNPATTTDATIITVADGQRALDNCLWWVAAHPVLIPDSILGQGDNTYDLEQRDFWISQNLINPVLSFTPDHQDFGSIVYEAYGFDNFGVDVAHDRYENDWQILQQDTDPNTAVNGTTNPNAPFTYTPAPAGNAVDTYDYAFAISHSTRARGRGQDFDGNHVAECGGVGVNCDDLTNPTFDPFWRAQEVQVLLVTTVTWNQDFEYHDGDPCDAGCRDSGVGEARHFAFLTAQDVNGYFEQCFNCNTTPFEPELSQTTYQAYTSDWNVVPTIIHAP